MGLKQRWILTFSYNALNLPAKEPTFRPAVAPASVCSAPREAIGFTEELLLELGDEPAIKMRVLKHQQQLPTISK